jgi:transposase
MLLRFVDGRPVRAVTTQCLAWLKAWLAAAGKTALLLAWDNASWHVSQAVRAWLKAHNRQVKQEDGGRIVVCPLPSKSPWLNRIEPTWVHGKRAIAEPARKLGGDEL